MNSSEIRKRFLDFFEKRGHAIVPSASLVPENDPSVLFNTAGMQPLVPYLMGQKHPLGDKLASCQKCVRTGDLDDIGDNRHFSFFEMLGNWSLGSYFKEDAIKWSFEFLTSKEEGLGLDPARLYVTVFEGDENAPEDTEAQEIWKKQGIPAHRIYKLGADDNWWSPGDNGPSGPCTEMFYDMTGGTLGDLSHEEFLDAVKREDAIEIWNDVFMEYEKKEGKVIGKLKQHNVDTGAGLERLTAVMQGKKTAYETDIFEGVMSIIKESSPGYTEKFGRIVADHLRTAAMLIADGVLPANKNQGYVLRRLIRRAIFKMHVMESHTVLSINVLKYFIDRYCSLYPEIKTVDVQTIFKAEEEKFLNTIQQGKKEFEKGIDPFLLATTYGFPIELTLELAQEKGISIDMDDFRQKMSEHQKLSQTSSAGMFKGGLANHNEQTVRLHTAHHLLLAALQTVLGESVHQRGSNITEERLRIDFSFERKMTDEEKKQVEELVNQKISEGLNVVRKEMKRDDAMALGAEMEFGAKYPEMVSVYFIGEDNPSTSSGRAFSAEFCGGPHVANTKELGHFTLQKEEAVSQGVRRIKGVLN
jgi:alanyl-tRNA synthetase